MNPTHLILVTCSALLGAGSMVAADEPACTDPPGNNIEEAIQEQAWTSPIWFAGRTLEQAPRQSGRRVGG